jgi:ferredoxin-thioredoxin reductase catalytic chain
MLKAALFVFAIVQGKVASFSLAPAAGMPRAPVAHSRQQQQRAAGLQLKAPEDPEHEAKVDKALKAMVGFSNSYCKNTGTSYCSDLSIPAVVIKGLAEHKVTLGAPLCPCRHYEDKEAEAKDGYWNCPCVPMRERHECHCMLFLTKDNEFAGDKQFISVEETIEVTKGMSIL